MSHFAFCDKDKLIELESSRVFELIEARAPGTFLSHELACLLSDVYARLTRLEQRVEMLENSASAGHARTDAIVERIHKLDGAIAARIDYLAYRLDHLDGVVTRPEEHVESIDS